MSINYIRRYWFTIVFIVQFIGIFILIFVKF